MTRHHFSPSVFSSAQPRHAWRWLLPSVLVLLFIAILLWVPWQAQRLEATERQEQLIADTLWVEQTIRFQFARDEDSLRLIGAEISAGYLSAQRLPERVIPLLRQNRELSRISWLDAVGAAVAASDNSEQGLTSFSIASQAAAERARRGKIPQYSQPAAAPGSAAPLQIDYFLPLYQDETYRGMLVATYRASGMLEEMVPWWFAQDNEITLVDADDSVIDRRAAGGPGRGAYTHRRALDLPGATLSLRTNSVKSAPKLLPNLLVGSVIALSLGLLWSVWLLWRHIERRLIAEEALRQQVSFRTAMENSLVTGLRARDLHGRVTYVNPAFCEMLGMRAEDLIGKLPPMPYWAPEAMAEYQRRFSKVLAGTITANGFETIFQRAGGERFPVLIYESPLVNDSGQQTGWMSSILDISDRRRIEELNRRQHEKLQTSARLASMGEIASTLAHELNQPLAAISSYTTGALNLLNNQAARGVALDASTLKPALEKASAQAQRAGQIIRSVHAFVKKRAPERSAVAMQQLLDNLMPLIELQAQPALVTVRINIAADLPLVLADPVMIEQVLLNLTRNAIEAMQQTPPEHRILQIVVRLSDSSDVGLAAFEPLGEAADPLRGLQAKLPFDTDTGKPAATAMPLPNAVEIAVIDRGHGIAPELRERLFTPFFSTKAEGMGMGLNICRSAIEFHGSHLMYSDNPLGGTIFRFTLIPVPPHAL